ncbi:MAG: YkgJ family cysteine cluster protein [Syntrophobacteraceae bacterium]|jgi:Fe-S-cluster containining protein
MQKESERLSELSINHPSAWDIDQFRANWFDFVEALLKEEANLLIPSRRVRWQIEQTPVFQEVVSGWDKMKGSHRLDAWKRMLLGAEEACRTILPACVQCGECCRMGSPTLHLEDLVLLQSGKIPWDQLVTLRKGEPARSPFDGRPFVLPQERIKVREKEGLRECAFLISQIDRCSIYVDRPLQCRAQACWDPIPARDTAELPFLLRDHIFEGVEVLLEIIAEHEARCGFAVLSGTFEELSRSNGGNVQEVLRLLSYEEHFRQFVSDKFKIPARNMELLFGRSFAQMSTLFGFRVAEEPDGTRCLHVDEPGGQT